MTLKSNAIAQKSTAKKTEKGPHGGGVKYSQMDVPAGFAVVKPRPGHTQAKNIK